MHHGKSIFFTQNISHHPWTLALPGGQWSNGWYFPILFLLIILFINFAHKLTPMTNVEVINRVLYNGTVESNVLVPLLS